MIPQTHIFSCEVEENDMNSRQGNSFVHYDILIIVLSELIKKALFS